MQSCVTSQTNTRIASISSAPSNKAFSALKNLCSVGGRDVPSFPPPWSCYCMLLQKFRGRGTRGRRMIELFVMEWHSERYKVSVKHNKYTARHTISVPPGNKQAGRAPDSRVTNPNSRPDRRNFYSLHVFKLGGGEVGKAMPPQ